MASKQSEALLPFTATGWPHLGQPGHAARRVAAPVRALGRHHRRAGRRRLHRDRGRRRPGTMGGAERLRRRPCAAMSHGGGYVVCSMYTHRKVYGHLAKAIGCRALIVHYGLAPENIHPGPVDDMVKLSLAAGAGYWPNHVALTGDWQAADWPLPRSSGCARLGLPLPAATMPLSPWLDMDATGETFETNRGRTCWSAREMVQTMAATFLGEGGNRQDPLVNPLHGDLGDCRRSTSRSAAMRPCWTTASPSPRRCGGQIPR